jgi:preprotein translocase, YajC subunit
MTTPTLSILAAAAAGAPPAWTSFIPFIGMGLVFWFLLLRPQMQQQKKHRAKLAGIKKGDQVVTGGGLVGKVTKVDEHYVEVELGTNMKVRAVRSTIGDVLQPGGSSAAND